MSNQNRHHDASKLEIQPVSKSSGIVSPNIGLPPSGINMVFSDLNFGLNKDKPLQSTKNGNPLSSQGLGHRRYQSSVDMSGIELPFEITGDEYDLPHSPRTYAYLEAIANHIHNTARNPPQTPISLNSKSAPSAQHLDPQRFQQSSSAYPTKDALAFQHIGNSTREPQHTAIDARSAYNQHSKLLPHFNGQYTTYPLSTRPGHHHRQPPAYVNTVPPSSTADSDPFTALDEGSAFKEQISNLGIGTTLQALAVSEVQGRELDLQDQLVAARAEIEELKASERRRGPPLALQDPSQPALESVAFAAENTQLGQSIGHSTTKDLNSVPPRPATSKSHQVQAPFVDPLLPAEPPWDFSRNIEEVRTLAEHWAEAHMKSYEQEIRTYPEVLRSLLINACGPELVRSLLESKKTRKFVVVRLLFGYLVDGLANTDILMGFDSDTDRQVANAQNTLNTPFSSVSVRKAALMDLAAVSAHIRGSPRWHEFLQMLFMKHAFDLWSIMEPLLPKDVNRSKANADLSIFVRESVKLAARMVGDAPGYEWTMVFHRAGVVFKGVEMVDRSAMIIGDPTASQNRNLRVKLSVTPTIIRREYVGMSIVAETMHRANVLLMG
ncbi:hypothetical protein GP486_000855 [Trichoglossum hirsutum]|uniref:Uncharacterized protein n=1 Tax=Trichoglossum hirsutum TaxID=265104 RepID=A0A9P8RTN5_9PEZI|nr:hypothetical protein GP486_000855 [Trichoglossum hirsutum]